MENKKRSKPPTSTSYFGRAGVPVPRGCFPRPVDGFIKQARHVIVGHHKMLTTWHLLHRMKIWNLKSGLTALVPASKQSVRIKPLGIAENRGTPIITYMGSPSTELTKPWFAISFAPKHLQWPSFGDGTRFHQLPMKNNMVSSKFFVKNQPKNQRIQITGVQVNLIPRLCFQNTYKYVIICIYIWHLWRRRCINI